MLFGQIPSRLRETEKRLHRVTQMVPRAWRQSRLAQPVIHVRGRHRTNVALERSFKLPHAVAQALQIAITQPVGLLRFKKLGDHILDRLRLDLGWMPLEVEIDRVRKWDVAELLPRIRNCAVTDSSGSPNGSSNCRARQ